MTAPPGDNRRGSKPHRTTDRTTETRQYFRQAWKALLRRDPALRPKPKWRKKGDTGRAAFDTAKNRVRNPPPPCRYSALKIMRRPSRIPAQAYAATTAYLSDTLDWMNLWQSNNSMDGSSELDDNYNPQ